MLVCVATATADDCLLAQYPRDVVPRDIKQATNRRIAQGDVVIDFDEVLACVETARVEIRTAVIFLHKPCFDQRALETSCLPEGNPASRHVNYQPSHAWVFSFHEHHADHVRLLVIEPTRTIHLKLDIVK